MSGRIDWEALAEPVVSRLLGEPNRKLTRGRRLRYGTHGSLSVDLDKGVWHDFEAEVGGGISKLVEWKLGVDWKGARRWLEQQGLIEPWKPDGRRGAAAGRRESGPDRKTADRGAEAASRDDPADGDDEAKRIGLARALWAAAEPIPDSPAMAYLARRGTWPARAGFGDGWPVIPPAVRWITRAALESVARTWEGRFRVLADFPADAAGAMVAGYLDMPDGAAVQAVTMDALTADGGRPDGARWRRTRGVLSGAACVMPANPQGREIAIVEGECDGLAVALMAWSGLNRLGDVAEVRVVGGTSGFQPDRAADVGGRPVLLLPDGPGTDGKGTAAGLAAACATRLRAAGRMARERMRPAGDEAGDPAGDLAVLLMERAARFERTGPGHENGLIEWADRLAWRSILGLETEGE